MIDLENDSNSICEEPKIYYYSSSSNFGVGVKFSERNKKIQKAYNMDFSQCSSKNNNNHFSLYNTIMLPFITTEATMETEQNYYSNNKNIIQNEKNNNKTFNNTRLKTESSKDDKNISDDKQLTNTIIEIKKTNNSFYKKDINNNRESIHLEENPFFLGRNLSINNNNKSKLKKSTKDYNEHSVNLHHNQSNHNHNIHHSHQNNVNHSNNNNSIDKNENDGKYFFDSCPSKSVICDDKNRKSSIKDDDKSENLVKKKKLNIKKSFLNAKSDNKKKFLKKKSFFIQPRNFKKEIEKEDKKDKLKTDIKNNLHSNRSKSYYYSNKQIMNYGERNFLKSITKKIKQDYNDNNNNDEKNYENVKRNSNKIKSQRVSNKQYKKKNSKDENKKTNNNKSNRLKISQISKGIKSLKDFINIKEKEKEKEKEREDGDNNSSKERSVNLKKNKKNEDKNQQRYNSKKEIKRIKLNRKDFEKEIVKGQKNTDISNITTIKEIIKNEKNAEEKEEKQQNKLKSSKQIISKELENRDSIRSKINKCYTADTVRKKNFNTKFKDSISSSGKKKLANMAGINLFPKSNSIKKQKKIDFEFALKNNLKKMQFNLFSKDKFTNTEFSDSDYLKYTLECMELILDLDIEKQTRLKNQINFNFPKPKKNKNKKRIALFDLDETIVHCTGDINTQKEKSQHIVEIKLPGKQAVKVGINIRPFWKQTLNLIKKKYHIVVYTASHQAYADSVLDFIDPNKKYFKYRLYRNNCSLVDVDGSKFYVKDLDIFKEHYDLKDIVIVDNSVLSFSFHLHNGIPIVPYYDEDKDGSLYVVGLYLIHIYSENDLREANKKQINLDSFMEEAKRRKEQEYVDVDQIDEESDSKEDDENNNDNNDNKNNDNKNEKTSGNANQKLSKKSLDDKNLRKKKISNKGFNIVKKHSSNLLCKLDPHSEQNNDIAQKKLMSQSKLLNMYYEVNDKSKNDAIIESKQEKKPKKNTLKERKGSPDEKCCKTNKTNIVFVDNNDEDVDCKSEPGIFPNLSDNDSSEDEKEMAILKRVYTIIEDGQIQDKEINTGDKTTKINSKSKLGFIRSNFYNNFKI